MLSASSLGDKPDGLKGVTDCVLLGVINSCVLMVLREFCVSISSNCSLKYFVSLFSYNPQILVIQHACILSIMYSL